MAWAEQLPSGKWRGVYRDADNRKRSAGTFSHKAQALRAASEREAKARRGLQVNPAGHRMRWGEWAEQWWPTRGVQAATQKSAEAKLRRHVRPRWADVPLGKITRIDVQRWVNELRKTLSASSVRQCYYILSQSLDAAIAEGHLEVSPCTQITLPTLPVGQERYLTRSEVDRIRYQLDGRYLMLVELLVGTGMRISEACGLHAHRVDLNRQSIEIASVYDPIQRTMRPYTKNRKSRSVPISDQLAEQLADWLAHNPPTEDCGYPHEGDHCRSGLVIRSPQGRAIDPHNFTNRVWYRAIDDAGLGKVRVHDLRHTYASWLLQAGIPIERVRELLGHGSVTTTERYAHLIPGAHDDVMAVLNGQPRGAEHGATPPPATPHDTPRRIAATTQKPLCHKGNRPALRLISNESQQAG